MFWNMYRIEQTKLFKSKLLWIELALIAMLASTIIIGGFLVMKTVELPPEAVSMFEEILLWPQSLTYMMGVVAGNQFGSLVMIILVGAFVAREYNWNTMSLWLSNGMPRPLVLGAKFIAIFLASLLVVLTALLVSGVLTLFVTVYTTGAPDLSQISLTQLSLNVLKTACTMLPYSMLTFFLAIRSRSAIAAIGGGVGFALVVEGILVQILSLFGGVAAKIAQFSPKLLAQSLSPGGVIVNSGMPGLPMLNSGLAFVIIIIYTFILFGMSVRAFKRQDLTT